LNFKFRVEAHHRPTAANRLCDFSALDSRLFFQLLCQQKKNSMCARCLWFAVFAWIACQNVEARATPVTDAQVHDTSSTENCANSLYYPKHYVAYKTQKPLVNDGVLDEPEWNEVAWTDEFVDISTLVKPRYSTRAKIRWDDQVRLFKFSNKKKNLLTFFLFSSCMLRLTSKSPMFGPTLLRCVNQKFKVLLTHQSNLLHQI
jgi:hypothetical protein